MKLLLPILFIILSFSAFAEDECIFDETSFIKFINKYNAEHRNSKIKPDRTKLIVSRNNEEIFINGGGCTHLGVTIELRAKKTTYTEEEFLQKSLDLSVEFGNWLINTKALKSSIEKGKYQKIDNTYYIEVDAMTVFNASFNNQGTINIEFYIN